jgi:hypothetical protein
MDCAAQVLMSRKSVSIQGRSQVLYQGEKRGLDKDEQAGVEKHVLAATAQCATGTGDARRVGMIEVLMVVAIASMATGDVTVAMRQIQATHKDWSLAHC